ncbi:MAG: MFS transporter [candidate division WOR-3 bacterium]|nr:MAG: MFS transporter [candidate division WOR-3 bacterium]
MLIILDACFSCLLQHSNDLMKGHMQNNTQKTNVRPTKLMNKNFFLLWQGQTVSQIGTQAFAIAMMYWIKRTTGSATLMGLIMMFSYLPSVFLAPLGGTFADRHSRRKIIIFSDVISGIVVLTLAGLMFITPESQTLIIIWLFIVAVIIAIVGSFFRPAIIAAIPDIVPVDKVAGANSLNQFSVQLSTFLGQALGGVLFRILGAPILFLIDGITYLFSAGSESFITIPQKISESVSTRRERLGEYKKDLIEGFKYIWQRTGMKSILLIAAALNFFAWPIILLLPFYVDDFLKVTADWYGFLLAAFSIGSMIGYLFAGALKIPGKTRSVIIIIFLVCQSIAFGILGFILIPLISLFILLLVGTMNGFININVITVLQVSTPSEIRGRIFGFLHTLTQALTPISMALAGVVADITNQNIPLIYLVCGTIMIFISISIYVVKEARDYLAFEYQERPDRQNEKQS